MLRLNAGVAAAIVLAGVFTGCADGDAEPAQSEPAQSETEQQSMSEPEASTPGFEARPAVLGVDADLQRELHQLIIAYVRDQQLSGDLDDNVARGFDNAMQRFSRTALEFGMEKNAAGGIDWPASLQAELLTPLRAKFDDKSLFVDHDVSLPAWADPLLREYESGEMTPARSELLFMLTAIELAKDMA